ncbi:hypothetical protein KC669_01375 [Candidatus Dojkabacteria bacterium]|uniref:DNA polymerase III subunit delta n=1 Tax=Candidatus Dojkabacteria bacterium TaxID=2099670 RepID=A0A955RL40_9BACT|nr:hypothetical protein [Candidatus Dojkabacteria bacterium]
MHLQSYILIAKKNSTLIELKRKAYGLLSEMTGKDPDTSLEIIIQNDPSIGIKHIEQIHEWNSKKSSGFRLGLIYNAHLLTVQAQNSILKLVEEPNHNTFIVLTTHSKNNLLDTIISRCKILSWDEDNTNKSNNLADFFLKSNYAEQKKLVYDYSQDRRKIEEFLDSLLEFFSIKNSETITCKDNQNVVELLGEWNSANSSGVNTKLIAQSILLNLGNYE